MVCDARQHETKKTKQTRFLVGSFAEAQANYLKPDLQVVKELDALVQKKKMGIVAHFYMDPELQVWQPSWSFFELHITC